MNDNTYNGIENSACSVTDAIIMNMSTDYRGEIFFDLMGVISVYINPDIIIII